MTDTPVKQFTLQEDGKVFYQPDATNPTPGDEVGTLSKGEAALRPNVTVKADAPALKDMEPAKAEEFVKTGVQARIDETLAVLVNLTLGDEIPAPVMAIAQKVYDAMGILPRSAVEADIAQLDADTRRFVRNKGVKLGPVLVFQPELNKPAAVRMRALLWSLANDKPLPAEVPNDGIVSLRVDPADIDQTYYQAIGYPVYGTRAIRIDMLDRVISAVYDAADQGKFQAQHQMAEWLGCPIEDLYAVLEAMGHKKAYDPADEVKAEDAEASGETKDAEPKDKDQTQAEKPALATFYLKRGKAGEASRPRGKTSAKPKKEKKPGKRNKKTSKTPKVMEVGPERKLEDSPFAVLQQLKVGKDGS